MTSIYLEAWFPVITASVAGLMAVTVRYSALFLGLLITLSKTAQADRPVIFREFAKAMRSGASCSCGTQRGSRARPYRQATALVEVQKRLPSYAQATKQSRKLSPGHPLFGHLTEQLRRRSRLMSATARRRGNRSRHETRDGAQLLGTGSVVGFGQVKGVYGRCPWLSAQIGGWGPAGTDI